MRNWRCIAIVACVIATVAARAGADETLLDEVVAVVDGQPVLRSELEGLRTSLARQGEEITDTGLLLERRIEDILLSVRAEALGIRVGEKEVDETVDSIAEQNGMTREQLYDAVANQGLNTLEYRGLLREQILRMQIVQREIEPLVAIDQADLIAYMKAHREDYSEPPEVELRILPAGRASADSVTATIAVVAPTVVVWHDLAPALQAWVSSNPGDGAVRRFPPSRDTPALWVQFLSLRPAELKNLKDVESDVYEKVRREKIERAFQHWFADLKAQTWVERFLR